MLTSSSLRYSPTVDVSQLYTRRMGVEEAKRMGLFPKIESSQGQLKVTEGPDENPESGFQTPAILSVATSEPHNL